MPARPKALVAMSGGVDSSVAAALLVREGWDVVGCFMRLGSPGEALDDPELCETSGEACGSGPRSSGLRIGRQGCCSINDAADARLVAAELGIPLYVCNFKRDFDRVIDYFVREYADGRTPNPCVRCNDWLKFGKLHDYAARINAEVIVSGHYARIGRDEAGRATLLRGVDAHKDQSYVLFGSPRAHLARMRLPIGEFEKPAVRELAERFGLPVFDKPDSQEICFVPDGNYAGLVEARAPELRVRGKLVDPSGRELGEHEGQHRYTIGQRRGLGVALGEPAFVLDRDARTNTVTIGPRGSLRHDRCIAGEANWLIDEPAQAIRCRAQFRAHGGASPATVRAIAGLEAPTPSGRTAAFEVVFDEPQEALAPGQAIVLYDEADGRRVLGGGWIARAG